MLRRSAILVTCLFALSLAIIGCGGGGGGGGTANPAGPAASSVETASLSGTVLFDSVPLANASVYLYKSEKAPTIGMTQLPALRNSLIAQQLISDGAYSTTTNAAGVYSFTDVPVGQYTLIAVKDENHQFAQTGVLLGQVTTLNPQLTPTGKIGGRVTAMIGTAEQGVSGVFVYVSGTSYIALTDASGYFVINSVPSNSLSGSTAYEVAVMPGKGSASPITGVVVNPGETTNVGTIALSQQATGYKAISGRLVAGAGATSADLANQFLILAAEADGALIGSSSDGTGNFSFFVNRLGIYHVIPTETFLNFAPASQTVTVTALDNATIALPDFVVSRMQAGGSVVAGTVTWPAVTDWNFTEGEIILEGSPYVDRRIISNQSPAPFRFENVPPGSYVLKTNPLRNGYAGTTAAFSVTTGVNLTDRALTGTFIAPIITSTPTTVAATPDQLTIPGANFGTVAANLLAFVNEKPATIISISDTSVVINIAQVPPGENVVQLVKILPEGRLPGNKKPFTRPVLAPLAASFTGSSTDTSITYNWQNAPHVTEVQIRLLQGAAQVRPPQNILGNSFTYNNLQPGITYTIEVISTYPNLPNSLPTTYPFATKPFSAAKPALVTLAGSNAYTSNDIIGFEMMNDTTYIAYLENPEQTGTAIYVRAYDSSGNPVGTPFSTSTPNSTANQCDLCAGGNSLFLVYPEGSLKIQKLSSSLVVDTVASATFGGGVLPYANRASIEFYDGYLFVSSTDDSTTNTMYVHRLDSSVANPLLVHTASNMLTDLSSGNWVKTVADEINGNLYVAVATSPSPFTAGNHTGIEILAKPLTTPGAAGIPVTILPVSAAPDELITDFKLNGGEIIVNGGISGLYYSVQRSTGMANLLNTPQGYFSSFGTDQAGRLWAFYFPSSETSDKYLTNISNGQLASSIKIADFANVSGNFANPREFIKRQIGGTIMPNKFGMLHKKLDGNLGVFYYDDSM